MKIIEISWVIFRPIEVINRRLADLESLILANQVGGRFNRPITEAPLSQPSAPSISPDRNPPTLQYRNKFGQNPSERDYSTEDDAPSPPGADHSLIDVNNETHGIEYYGGSSSVAILDRLYKRARQQSTNRSGNAASNKPSVVNLLHNPEFRERSPGAVHSSPDGIAHSGEPISSRFIEGGFLSAFFDTLHYMHPVIDKGAFIERCDKGAVETENDFTALYYTCLALAAITSPDKDLKLTGFSPIQWTNMYVDRAKKGMDFTLC
jgi:hypothetical protein